MPCPSEEEKRESCPFFCSSPPRLTLCPPREWYFQFDRVQLRHPRGKVISLAIAETRTDEPPTMQEQKRYRCFLSLSLPPSIIRPLFGNKRLIRFDATWNMNSQRINHDSKTTRAIMNRRSIALFESTIESESCSSMKASISARYMRVFLLASRRFTYNIRNETNYIITDCTCVFCNG